LFIIDNLLLYEHSLKYYYLQLLVYGFLILHMMQQKHKISNYNWLTAKNISVMARLTLFNNPSTSEIQLTVHQWDEATCRCYVLFSW